MTDYSAILDNLENAERRIRKERARDAGRVNRMRRWPASRSKLFRVKRERPPSLAEFVAWTEAHA